MSDGKKLIFVIGATGAQGMPVVKALLGPTKDGKPSPYRVRALSRNLKHRRVAELQKLGVEFIEGTFTDADVIARGMAGAYGAFVNTDGFSVGAMAELHSGIRIWEIAVYSKVKHFVWSALDYASKKGGFDPKYQVDHYDGKGRVGEFLQNQPNDPNGTMWTVYTNGPYMDMLQIGNFAPMNKRKDGTLVFATPMGNGHVPFISLRDLGWWARHIFDSPETTTGKNLEVCSQMTSMDDIVSTVMKVNPGLKAVHRPTEVDEYFDMYTGSDEGIIAEGRTTYRKNFGGFWRCWRDDVVKRDMAWIKSVHPGTQSLEDWMRETGYNGRRAVGLKNVEDKGMVAMQAKKEIVAKL